MVAYSIFSKANLALAFLGLCAEATPFQNSVRSAALAPTNNQVNLRVEGADGTIFEGLVYHPGPCTVTTASGGTHSCDGTNDEANPSPGAVPTCALNAAMDHTTKRPFAGPFAPFTFDGTYNSEFGDYFITTIGNTTETSTQFWGLLVNYQFTPTGGCQYETSKNDDVLWAFDAFNANYFLKLTGPADAVVGEPFTVTVIDGMSGNPVQGATVGGATTDAAGNAQVTLAKKGKSLLKAEAPSAIRSNFIAVHAKNA